jgi:hypothetical protein
MSCISEDETKLVKRQSRSLELRGSLGPNDSFESEPETSKALDFQTKDLFRRAIAVNGLGLIYAEQMDTRIHKANMQEMRSFLNKRRSEHKFVNGKNVMIENDAVKSTAVTILASCRPIFHSDLIQEVGVSSNNILID